MKVDAETDTDWDTVFLKPFVRQHEGGTAAL